MTDASRVDVVYTGSLAAVEVRHDPTRPWTFHYGKAISVPKEMAQSLLKRADFDRPEEMRKTISVRHPDPGILTLRRWGALGDLVMFRAACSAFRRARPDLKFILKCQKNYMGLFIADPLWRRLWAIGEGFAPGKDGVGREFNLDRVVEADHHDRGDVDRVTLFLETLMDAKLEVLPDDWVINVPSNISKYVDMWMQTTGLARATRPIVALQVRGSGPQKTVPQEQLRRLAAELNKRCEVVLIESDPSHVWAAPGVHCMVGRDPLHAVALLRRCHLCITPDSGVLWLAHAAKCPVLIFMGPRAAATRTNRHPLGPSAARAVQLNDLVVLNGKTGCPPCLEKAKACNLRYSCIREQPDDIFIGSIVRLLDEMLADAGLAEKSRIARESWKSRSEDR